jgi:predicted flap endonuclease-1-like 5' DNA nuclease
MISSKRGGLSSLAENYLSRTNADSEAGDMTMRLDYALYGVAVILFIITAGIIVSISQQNGSIIYGSLTGILGIISIGCGYFLKPVPKKMAPEPQITQTTPIAPEPEQKTPVATEAPKSETLVAEQKPTEVIPKVETPIAETTNMEHSIAVQTPQATQMMTPEPEKVVPPEECAVDTGATGLAQIKCISAKRAEQLNANGINTVEDLAKASSSELAAKLQVSEKIVKMWIGSAKKLVK